MNAKENARHIIKFDRPERVTGGYPRHGIGYHGCNHEGFEGGVPPGCGGHHLPVGSTWGDIWGTQWQRSHEGVMGFPIGNPLADLPANMEGYTWPDPDDERIAGQIYEQARGWDQEQTFLCGSHRDTLWEKCYMLVGMENAMCYFRSESQAMREVLHRIMDFQLGIARHYLSLGVEIVEMSDDLGTQSRLLLSPALIREFLLPEYRRLFELYKARGVLVNFHSCGHIEPALDMFLELGVDILNPVQKTANDLAAVRQKTAGRMALQGGISSGLIASGPIPAIRQEVRCCIRLLGSDGVPPGCGGGYFCCPDQGMPWPEENHQALIDAVEEFGCYPFH